MKAKKQKVTEGTRATKPDSPAMGGTGHPMVSAPGFGFVQHFTPDTVTIEEPGSSMTHTRLEVEGWLLGMNAAKRLSDENACREEVARTMQMNNGRRRSTALPIAILCALCIFGGRTARCSEIIRGYAPQDGQQLYAADLDNLIDESVIGVQFYNDQQTTPVLGSGYYFLVLNPANQTFYRINAEQALYGNTNLFLNAPPEVVPAYGLLLFCDPTNGWVASTTVSNFLWNSASNINVAGLSFANTNNGGATNAYVLPRWPYPVFSGLNTNYPAHFIVFDTNGVPYRMGLSNVEVAFAFDLGTVMSLPYEYEQEFGPWRLYGTNTVAPYTNAFGWTTNFPITAYYQTNISGSNLPSLLPTDTIPINAGQQGTNTSATIQAIYQYMTNLNALPPYTLARDQFGGIYAEWNVTNMNATAGFVTNYAPAVNFTNPQPVSFAFAQGTTLGNPYTPTLASNVVYWAQVTNEPVLTFQVFTNLASAVLRTNPVLGLSGYISQYATLLWLTNYASVNAAVIQDCIGTTIEPGMYSCYFLTSSATPYYYLSGSCEMPLAGSIDGASVSWLNYSGYQLYTTNGFSFDTAAGGTVYQCPMVQILVQPE